MVVRIRTVAIVLSGLFASTQTAAAQNVADTAKRWGLLGTWALDCSQPASRSNGYLSYVVRTPGKLSHERNFGDASDVNEVQQARTGRGGWLELVVNFPGLSQTRKYTLMMGPDGRTKAMSNTKADGTEATIVNGKFTANGNDTPWQVRCR